MVMPAENSVDLKIASSHQVTETRSRGGHSGPSQQSSRRRQHAYLRTIPAVTAWRQQTGNQKRGIIGILGDSLPRCGHRLEKDTDR